MAKSKITTQPLFDNLLYIFMLIAFMLSAVSTISYAKYISKVNSNAVGNVSNAVLDFTEGEDGVIVLSGWKPGDTKTSTFSIKNYTGTGDSIVMNQVSITYNITITTSAILPLEFNLTKNSTIDESTHIISFAKVINANSTFSTYTATSCNLQHSLTQEDTFTLEIEWPAEFNSAEMLKADGEYIKIDVDWQQQV